MIDILIPTYNRAHTIIETINSALNQINVDVVIHVIDNNSTDNTVELIKSEYFKDGDNFDNLFLHEFNETVPMHSNWNRCLKYINSKYFKFLFSDDLLSPSFCYECLKVFEKYPTLSFVATDLNYFEINVKNVYKIRKYNKEGLYDGKKILFRSLLSRNNISAPSNCLIKSSKINNFKFVNNRVATDWIFFSEILYDLENSKNYYYLEKPLAYFRTSGLTETNKLKMSADWVILNFEARKYMSNLLKFHKKTLAIFFTLIYCLTVLVYIKKISFSEYIKAKKYLNKQSVFSRIFYVPIRLVVMIPFVNKFLINR